MKILLIPILLSFSLLGISQSQLNPFVQKVKFPNGIIRCGTVEIDSIRRANDPSLPTLEEYEVWLAEKIIEYKQNKLLKATVVTIPVVVHVVHNGDALGTYENISDAQVMSQIEVLNQDFRRMQGTNGFNNDAVGADVEIEFCLAQFDTLGNAINGIDRVQRAEADWSNFGDLATILQPATIWDPTQYMNIWTVDFGGSGLLGLTQHPDNSGLSGIGSSGGAASSDGLVINHQAFGSIEIAPSGTYMANYDKGRTVTHEAGHFFGLIHVWGDGGCGVDDYCLDTPDSDASHFGCPQDTSCGTADMVQNYMDYSDDACMNIFTEDQKTRMRTVLSVSPRRMELINSTVCGISSGLDVGISDIVVPTDVICDSTISPVVKLFNFGTDTLFSTDIYYEFDGSGTAIYQWSGVLLPGSFELVSLQTYTGDWGGHTYTAYTVGPNSGVDVDESNDITSKLYEIIPCIEELGVISNNVFTPNNDGANDGFIIDIPELITNDNTVVIYNRWGDILHEFVNYNNNDVIWKGNDKSGNMVSNGTYFYIIEIPSINYSNSGWIQVIK